MTIFDRTKKIADSRGMSLQDVAKQAGLGINSIYAWKNRDPSTTRLNAVAKVLKVPVSELLDSNSADSTTPETTDSRIDVDDIINNQRRLFYKNEELSDEDKDFIDTFLRTYLESKEGQDRLRKNGYKGK